LRDQEQPIDRAQNQQLPSFANLSQNNEFFPSNQPPGEGPGNVPQAATGGIKRPVLDAKQLIAEGKRISKQQTDEGIPTNVKQGYDLAKEINDETKIYNEQIDAELAQRVKSQQQYGQRSEEQLLKLFPEATGEQRAIFKKKGEQIARGSETQSEADIDRHIAKEATKFKNTISNIEKDMSAPRSQNLLQRKFLGTEKDFESASNDLRVKLKPLLDDGLYDTARSLLQRLGYAPEERESVVNPLTERAQRTIKLVPNAQKVTQKRIPGGATGGGGIPIIQVPTLEYSPRAKEDLKSNLQDVFNADPNASLVLVRKGFEDKGYDWRIFRDGLNDLLQTPPDQGGIQLNDDQQAQIQHLDSPPLNALEKILHGLKIIGR
jgi:hypothetical protein